MALINPNAHVRQLRDLEDRLADAITRLAGNIRFVYLHAVWFGAWIAVNLGLFGPQYIFDPFPFGLLTMTVSLEAIFLSTFVLISQNRASQKAEIRAQLDYETDLQSEKEITILMQTLSRIAVKQGVDIKDLETEMAEVHHLARREADRRAKS
jgi:uncharacterized membrane protein